MRIWWSFRGRSGKGRVYSIIKYSTRRPYLSTRSSRTRAIDNSKLINILNQNLRPCKMVAAARKDATDKKLSKLQKKAEKASGSVKKDGANKAPKAKAKGKSKAKASQPKHTEPEIEAVAEPQGEAAAEPQGEAAAEPEGEAVAKPEGEAAVEPSASAQPEIAAASRPWEEIVP